MTGGIACCVAGSLLLVLAFLGLAFRPFLATGMVSILAGGFQIFESRNGWCAIRAMGIKTRF